MTNGDALVMGAKSGKPSTAILINDYSNGNDMVIGGPGIEKLADLKGKKMGVEVGFVSHLLLLKALESAGMKRVGRHARQHPDRTRRRTRSRRAPWTRSPRGSLNPAQALEDRAGLEEALHAARTRPASSTTSST